METLKFEKKGFVGILTINREKALNALNSTVLDELLGFVGSVDTDEIRCLIITGAGEKSFVAGADIKEMKDLNKAEGEAFGAKGNAVMRGIETLAIPVIAAVNGYALGGGCELAMACDIRIASEKAIFAQPETGLGIIPGFGGTQRMPRLISTGIAKEMIYTGRRMGAEEAKSVGLVNKVCKPEDLMNEAMAMAEMICETAPIGNKMAKKSINDGTQVDMDSAIKIEAKAFGDCFDTADQKNAMSAFVEKRKHDPFINK